MPNESTRHTHRGKSHHQHRHRSKASDASASAATDGPAIKDLAGGNMSNPPTGCAGQAHTALQSTAVANQQQSIDDRAPATMQQPPERHSAAKSTLPGPLLSSAIDATTSSPQRQLNTGAQAGQRDDHGQPSVSTAARTNRVTSETSPLTYGAKTTVTTTKERTRSANDKTGTGYAVKSRVNPTSIMTSSATSANAGPLSLTCHDNVGAASGQPSADVSHAATTLSPTPAPSSAAEKQLKQSGEPRSPPSRDGDLIISNAATAKYASRLEEALAASLAVSGPHLKSQRSRGSKVSGFKRHTSEQLDKSLFENIAIRRSPTAETAATKKVVLTRVVRGAILIVAVFTLIGLFFIFLAHLHTDGKFCDTPDCIHHAGLLARIVSTTIDPCDDFSAFVCSGWQQARFDEHVKSTIEGLRFAWYREFGETLRKGTTKIRAGRKAIVMYEMCVGRRPVHGSQLPLLRAFLQEVHLAWPEPSNTTLAAFSVALLLSYRWQAPFWISVIVFEDHRLGRRRIVVRPGTYVPVLLKYHRRVAQVYQRYYKIFYALYSSHGHAERVKATAVDEIRVMEEVVLSRLNSVAKSPSQTPSLFSFSRVDRRIPNASTAYWLPRFDEGLQLQPQLTPDDEVLVTDLALFQAFYGLVVKYGDQDLKTLLAWQLVQLYSPIADTDLMTTRFGSKQQAETFRPAYCAYNVEASFKVLVLSLGTVSRVTAEERQLISSAFGDLVSTALGKVSVSRWVDSESKARVVQKLVLVQMKMWPPESLLSGDVLEETYSEISEDASSVFEYWVTSRNTTAQMNLTQDYKDALNLLGSNSPFYFDYDYFLNSVQIALGAAAPPAYYKDGTSAMFYGGLGFLMAMQLVRSIDDEGLKWAPNNSIVHSILSESTARSYRERERCAERNGNKSIFPEVPAMEIAFSAFKASRLRDGMEHLPLGPHLPEDKVFFLTLCFMTCVRKSSLSRLAVDCNKMVQNSEAFAHVYDCRKGSRMNPAEKCLLFDA